jgi:LacI family transcriptional regulator
MNHVKEPVSKKSTIYDVAAKAGVSTATVSRLLSNSGYPVSAELKQRILSAVEALNYTPNIVGRLLKNNRSTDIGIVIPTISNPYYAMLILGAEQEARRQGYNLFLCNSLRDAATERKYLESLFQKQVRGILISTVGENSALLREIQKYGMQIVTFDHDPANLHCSRIGFDYAGGAMMAVEHLINNGHKRIAFLSAPITKESRRDVLSGYKQGLQKNGMTLRNEYIVISRSEEELEDGTYEFENGRRLAGMFLELTDRPTAILAINDLTAVGVMHELAAHNVKVPDDVSVMGFDNIEFSAMVSPPLTTIHQPAFETGRSACRILLDRLNGERSEEISIIIQPTLVIRKSVKNISD